MKSQFFTAIKSILSAFRSVFFPENCIICSKELEESGTQICENCKENAFIRNVHKDEYFAPLLPFCEDVFVMFHYNYVKKGIISFKFKKQITQGKHLANLLAQGLKKQDWIKEIDYVIPIPLHPKAQRKRQFNQCEIIADILSKELGIKKQADNLF
ncbi:MAG: ComF family protein [Bacteroidales bacterium]|nr:ComF family protein [Bacteroidales bacterium]